MSNMWPEPPDPGRGYPQQKWVRYPRWVTALAVAGILLVAGCCAAAFWVRPVLP